MKVKELIKKHSFALLFVFLISGLVFTFPSGIVTCDKELGANYCKEVFYPVFFVFPWFWPIGFLTTLTIGSPVLTIFQYISTVFSLGWELPLTPQPLNERNAYLPLIGWIILLVLFYGYSKLLYYLFIWSAKYIRKIGRVLSKNR